jgi:lysophospholipase L1-like esterase
MGYAAFAVRAISQASPFPSGYDPQRHQYDPRHITPTHWKATVRLDLLKELAALRQQHERASEPVSVTEVDSHGVPRARDHAAVRREREEREAQEEELQAAVNELENLLGQHKFVYSVVQHKSAPLERWVPLPGQDSEREISSPSLQSVIALPSQGLYRFTVRMLRRSNNQEVEVIAKELLIRDLFICTIGDSYACGEGNPDTKTGQDFSELANLGPLDTLYRMRAYMQTGISPNLDAATWQEPLAHRSKASAPALAAGYLSGDFNRAGPCITFVNLARSGASIEEGIVSKGHAIPQTIPLVVTVTNGVETRVAAGRHWARLNNQQNGTEILIADPIYIERDGQRQPAPGNLDAALNMSQLEELDALLTGASQQAQNKPRRPDILITQLGGNDVQWIPGFVEILTPGGTDLYDVKEVVSNAIRSTLPNSMRKLNERIALLAAQPRFVLITEYPDGFFGTPNGLRSECGVFAALDWVVEITKLDASVIHDLARALNDQLKAQARELNEENTTWNTNNPQAKRDFIYAYVDGIAGHFAEHGYCAPTPYFVGAGASVAAQGDFLGLLHPNNSGQQVIAGAIANKIRAILRDYPTSF